jgi:hypothetical protein
MGMRMSSRSSSLGFKAGRREGVGRRCCSSCRHWRRSCETEAACRSAVVGAKLQHNNQNTTQCMSQTCQKKG